ncbi:hypothetical protein AX16_005075 [Volvariella volvacea WC 439]|nr:hypothetical protein AX16_005075 [Volvariella volvacea WC 439]
MLASRTFARTVWFHVPDMPDTEQSSAEEMKARAMIEKKTVINLLEAYAVALKHYLRGEDGIYYKDLYYLVKFLPAYALPPGLPHHHEPSDDETLSRTNAQKRMTHHLSLSERAHHLHQQAQQRAMASDSALPLPVTTPSIESNYSQIPSPASGAVEETIDSHPPIKKTDFAEPQVDMRRHRSLYRVTSTGEKAVLSKQEESYLFPAQIPPKYHYFDIFPFSLLIKCLTRKGKEVRGKKAARLRAKMKDRAVSHNLPLEISLYLSSYVAAVQHRKIADVPTINTLHSSLNQLVDSLTGLERILTTPIPFSYSFHLWIVTVIYCLSLPFQIWPFLEWLTIPSTVVASFIFFGFLVAGEEIENPFGYDKNDLVRTNVPQTELLCPTCTL